MEKEIRLLRSKFYLPFIPGPTIKMAKLPLYKIVAINVGYDPIKRILINKLTDGSKLFVSYDDLDFVFKITSTAASIYDKLGFSVVEFDNYIEIAKKLS